MQDTRESIRTSPSISRYVFLGFAAVAAFFLIVEHRVHLYGLLPFLLLAACPLLHFFHRGHRHGIADRDPQDSDHPRREGLDQ